MMMDGVVLDYRRDVARGMIRCRECRVHVPMQCARCVADVARERRRDQQNCDEEGRDASKHNNQHISASLTE
jgi:hypothetical protein